MNHYQSKQPAHTRHQYGATERYSRYETGVIVGRHRDMPAVIVDEDGFDGMGVQTYVGGNDDNWCVLNLFDAMHRYIDSVAINGAMDDDHAVTIALSQFNHLDPAYASVVAKDSDDINNFDSIQWSSTAIHRVLSLDSQNSHYLPIINKKQLQREEERIYADTPLWDGVNVISHDGSISKLFLDMQKHDVYHKLTTPLDLRAMLDGVTEASFDAIVESYNRLDLFKERLFRAMAQAPSNELKVVNVTMTKPFKRQGVANVAIVFELSDGQSISIWFYNPDATPAKIGATDVMASWKWLLNTKDVTAVLSPPNGENVQMPMLAKRMMLLAVKNSKRFAAAQKRKGENQAKLTAAQAEVDGKLAMMADLDAQIKQLQQTIDEATRLTTNTTPTPKQVMVDVDNEVVGADGTPDERLNAKVEQVVIHNPQEAVGQDEPQDEPVVLTGDEFGEFDLSDESDVKKFAQKVYQELDSLNGEFVFNKSLNANVKLNTTGLNKIRRYNGLDKSPVKLQAVAKLKEIVANAKLFKTDDSYDVGGKKGGLIYYYLKTPFIIDGTEYGARIVIRGDGNGNFYYDFQVKDNVSMILDSMVVLDSQTKNPLGRDISYDWKATSNGFDGYSTDFDNESQVRFDGMEKANPLSGLQPTRGIGFQGVTLPSGVASNDADNPAPVTPLGNNDTQMDSLSQDVFIDDDTMLDSAGSKMVLNLFIFDKDGNEIGDEPKGDEILASLQPRLSKIKLHWSEAGLEHDNLEFHDVQAMQAWFSQTFTDEFFKSEDWGGYFKNKLELFFENVNGMNETSVEVRIDVKDKAKTLKGDYNPKKFTFIEWLEENYQSFSGRGFSQEAINELIVGARKGQKQAEIQQEVKEPPHLVIDENQDISEPKNNTDKLKDEPKYEYRPHGKDLTFLGQEFDHTPTGDNYTVWGVAKGEERWGVAIAVETVNMGKKITTKKLAQKVADVMAERFGYTQLEIRSDRAFLGGGVSAIKNAFGAGALSQTEQENTMNEPQNTEQPQDKETTGQAVAQILVNEYGWQYTNNQRTHIALGRYTNDKFGEFAVSADIKDDDIVANQPLTNVFIGGARDVVQDAKDFHRRTLDWLDGYQSKAVGKNAPEPNQNAEPTQEDKPMNEPQNQSYTQSDIDYLQSIINGTLDLETVDMDKMIEIGEKDEHDPMYEQALQIVSDYLDEMSK